MRREDGLLRLQNKTCILTGGAGSLGMATARLMLEEGARVMLVDRTELPLKRAEDAFAFSPDRVATFAADVSRAEEVERFVTATVERFGPIDVLFSNAGNFGIVAPIESYPVDVFDDVCAVHVRGAFLACKYTVPKMNDGGAIVITSSVAATRGDPGVYAYITAKHAQVGLMRCLAKELAPRRIRVNTIHPGPIDNRLPAQCRGGADAGDRTRRRGVLQRADTARPPRRGRGDRALGPLPRVGRCKLRDRRNADGRRRHERLNGRCAATVFRTPAMRI